MPYFKKKHKHHNPVPDYTPEGPKEILEKKVEDLGLHPRTLSALQGGKVFTVADIMKRTEREMYKIQNFGKKNLDDIKRVFQSLGVDFRQDASQTNNNNNNNAPIAPAEPKVEKPTTPGTPEEWIKFSRNGKWGFRNLFQKEVIPPTYDEIFHFKEGLACYETEGDFGYIDPENKIVIKPQFECAMSFSEGLASVTKEGKCGYIDKTGTVIIDYQFDAATAFTDGKARVKSDGKWGSITKDGEIKWDK